MIEVISMVVIEMGRPGSIKEINMVEFGKIEQFDGASYDFNEECKALVAFSDADTGVVVYFTGGGLDYEFSEAGLSKTVGVQEDMPLPFDYDSKDWPPADDGGIWVWEGHLEFVDNRRDMYNDDVEELLQGTWREPTEEEWDAIKKNESPW
jgi:hypothetical protein